MKASCLLLLAILAQVAGADAQVLQVEGYLRPQMGVAYSDLAAFEIFNASATRVEDCAAVCSNVSNCSGFTFVSAANSSKNSSCVGRTSVLKPYYTASAEETVASYVKSAAVLGRVDNFVKLREGFDFLESTITMALNLPNASACGKLCLNTSGCRVFVYFPKQTLNIAHEWWLGNFSAGTCRLVRGARAAVPSTEEGSDSVHAYMLRIDVVAAQGKASAASRQVAATASLAWVLAAAAWWWSSSRL